MINFVYRCGGFGFLTNEALTLTSAHLQDMFSPVRLLSHPGGRIYRQ